MSELKHVGSDEIKRILDTSCAHDETVHNMLDDKVRKAYFDGMRAGVASLERVLQESGVIPID